MIARVVTKDIDSQTYYLIDTMLVRPISTNNINIYLIKVSIMILTTILRSTEAWTYKIAKTLKTFE